MDSAHQWLVLKRPMTGGREYDKKSGEALPRTVDVDKVKAEAAAVFYDLPRRRPFSAQNLQDL